MAFILYKNVFPNPILIYPRINERNPNLWYTALKIIAHSPLSMSYLIRWKLPLFILILIMNLFTNPYLSSHESNTYPDELAWVRQIIELYKTARFSEVSDQVNEFILFYPTSNLYDYTLAIKGNALFEEKKYEEALVIYELISQLSLYTQSEFNYLHALYQLKKYQSLREYTHKILKENASHMKPQDIQHVQLYLAYAWFHLLPNQKEEIKTILLLCDELQGSIFESHALPIQAELNVRLENWKKAAESYSKLTDLFPKYYPWQREMALCQSHFDLESAHTSWYKAIAIATNAKEKEESTLQWLSTSYLSGNYQQIIQEYPRLLREAPLKQNTLAQIFLAQNHLSSDDCDQFYEKLLKIISQDNVLSSPSDHLLALVTLSAMTFKLGHYEKTLDFIEQYEKKTDFATIPPFIRFIKALSYKKLTQYKQAAAILEAISPLFSHALKEDILFEQASLYYLTGDMRKSYEQLSHFLFEYPQSKQYASALEQKIRIGFELLYQEPESSDISYQKIIEEIIHLLHSDLAQEKRAFFLLALANSYYLTKDYTTCDQVLKQNASILNQKKTQKSYYLLKSACLIQQGIEPIELIDSIEKALKSFPETSDDFDLLHLHAFNAYVHYLETNSSITNSSKTQVMAEHAAEHLYSLLEKNLYSLDIDNLHWLATYYYNSCDRLLKGQWEIPTSDLQILQLAQKGIAVYEKLLERHTLFFTHRNYYSDLPYLSALLKISSQWDRFEQLILPALTHIPENEQALSYQLFYDLAYAYLQQNQKEKALIYLRQLTTPLNRSALAISYFSRLHTALIDYEFLPPCARNENSEAIKKILQSLDFIQTHKMASTEPFHLEAALEKSKMIAELQEPALRLKTYLDQLTMMKYDFTSQSDILSKDYFRALNEMSYQKLLYHNYFLIIDAYIALTKSRIASENKDFASMNEHLKLFHELAKALYYSKKMISNPYLDNRIQNILEISDNESTFFEE